MKAMSSAQPQVGPETLEGTPERLLHFLLAIARYPTIRRRMRRRGYGTVQHRQGYRLLGELGEYDEPTTPDRSDPGVKHALQQLNAADEDALALAGAALRYKFPAHHDFVLEGLSSSREEGEAANTMGTLLDRMNSLEAGDVPKKLQAEAGAALEAMAQKGLNSEWREQFGEFFETVRTLPDEGVTTEELEAGEKARRAKLLEIRAFFEEWTDTARVEFKARRQLIRLGLAQLRRSDSGDVEVVEAFDQSEASELSDISGSGERAKAAVAAQ